MLRLAQRFLLTSLKSLTLTTRATEVKKGKKNNIAERGFDPRTSGLWAQHASTAPLC